MSSPYLNFQGFPIVFWVKNLLTVDCKARQRRDPVTSATFPFPSPPLSPLRPCKPPLSSLLSLLLQGLPVYFCLCLGTLSLPPSFNQLTVIYSFCRSQLTVSWVVVSSTGSEDYLSGSKSQLHHLLSV